MDSFFLRFFFFVSLFDICTRFPPLVRCHHKWALPLDSELSLDLQAVRSAILVSRLSILLLKTLLGLVDIVDFFRLHFSVQVEIEKEALKNELSFLDQVCCGSDSCNHHRVPHGRPVVLCTRSPQLLMLVHILVHCFPTLDVHL